MASSVTLVAALLYSQQQSAFLQPATISKCNYGKSGLICEILR